MMKLYDSPENAGCNKPRLSPFYIAIMLSLLTGCAGQINALFGDADQPDDNIKKDGQEAIVGKADDNSQLASKSSATAKSGAAMPVALNQENNTVLEGKTITTININGLADETYLNNARTFLTLEKIVGEPISRVDYTAYLIEQGKDEIAKSLQPFGYYNVEVVAKLAQSANNLVIDYDVKLNKPVTIRKADVSILGEALQDDEFQALLAENPLQQGRQLNHATYEQYKARFDSLSRARGYFEAKFTRNVIYVDTDSKQADIELTFDSGPRYRYGDVSFTDDVPLNKDLLQRFVSFDDNAYYQSRDVAILQQDLQGSGYFQQVLVGNNPDPVTKTVPIDAKLTMNKNKHYVFGIGYSTNEGVRGKFNFDRRWVNRRGHTLSSNTFVSEKKFSLDNIYRIPADNPTTDYYYFRAGASHEEDGYKSTRIFGEGGYNFVKDHWSHRYALVSAWEDFTIGLDSAKTLLTYPHAKVIYSSNDDRISPESGYQVGLSARGGVKGMLSDVSFAQSELQLRALYSIDGKNKITGRTDLGATWSDDFNRLPPDLRYFAGGDRSVRGYGYRSIGGRDQVGNNIGGKYLISGGLEYQYFFKPEWAAAVFVDAGDAFINQFSTKIGAGIGARWDSPVGPISIDLAHGFNEPNEDKVRLHINIGTELDL